MILISLIFFLVSRQLCFVLFQKRPTVGPYCLLLLQKQTNKALHVICYSYLPPPDCQEKVKGTAEYCSEAQIRKPKIPFKEKKKKVFTLLLRKVALKGAKIFAPRNPFLKLFEKSRNIVQEAKVLHFYILFIQEYLGGK